MNAKSRKDYLVDAAPELLDALYDVLTELDDLLLYYDQDTSPGSDISKARIKALRAIAKAEGRLISIAACR